MTRKQKKMVVRIVASALLLVGAVLVESVFAMGGLGDLLISGIKAADYPLVQSITLLMVFVFLCINLLVDIFYAVLDPRIRMK